MAAQDMPLRNDAPDKLRVTTSIHAYSEKGGVSVIIPQHIQDMRRILGMRSIIEGESHGRRRPGTPGEQDARWEQASQLHHTRRDPSRVVGFDGYHGLLPNVTRR